MKQLFFNGLVLSSMIVCVQQAMPQAPGLGTTHFVVPAGSKGIPPQGQISSQAKPLTTQHVPPQRRRSQSFPAACAAFGPFTCNADGSLRQVFFSPDEQVREKLIYLIDHEQKEIKIAVFTMTERLIADALVRAMQRGVKLSVIVDPICVKDRYNKVGLLCDQGVCTYVYNPHQVTKGLSGCMHHKFALFTQTIGDKSILWTGSFNFTKSASISNHENALVLDDKVLFKRFDECFQAVLNQSYRYKMHKKNHASA